MLNPVYVRFSGSPATYRVERHGEGFLGPRAPCPPPDEDGIVSFTLDLPPGEYSLRFYGRSGSFAGIVGVDHRARVPPAEPPPGICGKPTADGSPCKRAGRCPYHS